MGEIRVSIAIRKKVSLLASWALLAGLGAMLSPVAHAQEVAITFDDLPNHGPLPAGETREDVARKILAAMPDGSGAVMIEGRMQDDATWKQARVIVDLARQVARKDPEFAALYAFDDVG